MRKRPLLWFACVFLCGLAYGRYAWLALLCVPIYCVGTEIYYGVKHKLPCKMAGRSMVLLSAFLLGMTHMHEAEVYRDAYMSELQDDSEVVLWGEIQKIENTDYGVRMVLTDCYIRLNEDKVPCNDIVVYASSTHFHVGEIHKIKGQLNLFETARNQGNFDSKVFYQSQKQDFSVWLETNELLGLNENRLRDFVLSLKERLTQVFIGCMDESAAGFFSGMLLGDKSLLDEKIKDLFTLGGISHILAISGLHVSIIGRGLYKLLRRCRIGFLGAGFVAGCLLLIYGFLVGNGMSAVRAIGMMLIFFLGQCLGRSYDMLNALGAMVIYLLWENPFLLEYSGFWFSIMALIGVGFVGNVFSEIFANFGKIESKNGGNLEKSVDGVGFVAGAFRNLGMSFGITLTTLPVVAYCYYEIPMYSPLVNFIVLPMLTPIFVIALCGGLIGLWIPALAKLLLIPCSWGLAFYIWVCEFVEKLPFASIICGQPKPWVIVVYYMVLALGVVVIRRSVAGRADKKGRKNSTKEEEWKLLLRKEKRFVFFISLVCLILIIYPKDKPCEITFLDVGQGDGIYISTGDDTTYFIDGGSTSVDGVGEYRILPFLKAKGVISIDYWFVSHADTDHISGLLEVMESGYEVGHLVLSKYAPKDENLEMLVTTAEACGVDVIYMDTRDYIQTKYTKIECLYPWEDIVDCSHNFDTASNDEKIDRNDTSMVLELEIKEETMDFVFDIFSLFSRKEDEVTYKALFAGDISSEVEEVLLESHCVGNIWLYKASHHGSKYSTSEALLETLQPEITVISCGENNIYRHPHEEVIERLESVESQVLQTQNRGQITVYMTDGGPDICFIEELMGKSDTFTD